MVLRCVINSCLAMDLEKRSQACGDSLKNCGGAAAWRALWRPFLAATSTYERASERTTPGIYVSDSSLHPKLVTLVTHALRFVQRHYEYDPRIAFNACSYVKK